MLKNRLKEGLHSLKILAQFYFFKQQMLIKSTSGPMLKKKKKLVGYSTYKCVKNLMCLPTRQPKTNFEQAEHNFN